MRFVSSIFFLEMRTTDSRDRVFEGAASVKRRKPGPGSARQVQRGYAFTTRRVCFKLANRRRQRSRTWEPYLRLVSGR